MVFRKPKDKDKKIIEVYDTKTNQNVFISKDKLLGDEDRYVAKKYKLTEELGAVQRRGVKLGQQKKLTGRLLGVKQKKKKKK